MPVKKALQRLNTASLEAALQHAGRIDRLAKGIGQGNLWEEFLRLGLSLCSPGKLAARNSN
jgi:DNA polymerase III subunit delta